MSWNVRKCPGMSLNLSFKKEWLPCLNFGEDYRAWHLAGAMASSKMAPLVTQYLDNGCYEVTLLESGGLQNALASRKVAQNLHSLPTQVPLNI